MSAPTTMSQYIDALCEQMANFQDRFEASPESFPLDEAQRELHQRITGEMRGMRGALAIALGLDPDEESLRGKAADVYYTEWRERHGR
jgi:hypothetical protein